MYQLSTLKRWQLAIANPRFQWWLISGNQLTSIPSCFPSELIVAKELLVFKVNFLMALPLWDELCCQPS